MENADVIETALDPALFYRSSSTTRSVPALDQGVGCLHNCRSPTVGQGPFKPCPPQHPPSPSTSPAPAQGPSPFHPRNPVWAADWPLAGAYSGYKTSYPSWICWWIPEALPVSGPEAGSTPGTWPPHWRRRGGDQVLRLQDGSTAVLRPPIHLGHEDTGR